MGLGIAYAGSAREDLLELLVPIVVDTNVSVELSAMAALSLGLVFVGRCNEDVTNAILQTLAERPDDVLDVSIARFFSLGIALLFMGQ
jgi:26S proteasome regulatory subunit N1